MVCNNNKILLKYNYINALTVLSVRCFSIAVPEGEQVQGGPGSCLDPPRVSEGFLTAPPSGEVTPTTPAPHEQALVSLETAISQQVHQPIADLLLAESHASSLAALAVAGLPPLSAVDRLNSEAEASQMEMSPAPTIGERGGGGGGGVGAVDGGREGRITLKTPLIQTVQMLSHTSVPG